MTEIISKIINTIKIKGHKTNELELGDNSEYINMMTGFFKRSAIWKSKMQKQTNWLYFSAIVITMVVDILNGVYNYYLNHDKFHVAIEILFFTFISLHTLLIISTFICKQKTVTEILNTLETRFEHFEESIFKEPSDVWISEERKSVLQTKICFYLILTDFVMFFYKTNIFYLNPRTRKTLYPIWTPFLLDSPMYYAAVVYQILVLYFHITVHIMSAGLFAGGANLYGAMTDCITRIFQNILRPDKFSLLQMEGMDSSGAGKDAIQTYLLQKAITLHVVIKRFEKQLNSVYGLVFLEIVFMSEVLICFSGYHLVQALLKVDLQTSFNAILTISLMIIQIFVYCWFGEKIYRKGLMITHDICYSEWYKCSLAFRKSFRIVLLNTMKDVKISYYGIVTATFKTFVQTLKAAFSFLNILIVLSKEQLF